MGARQFTEKESIIIYGTCKFSAELQSKSRKVFKEFVADNVIVGEYSDKRWVMNSGVKRYGVLFQINIEDYQSHIGKEFGIGLKTMEEMIKCYAVYLLGNYVSNSIANFIRTIIRFLEKYGDKDYKIKKSQVYSIADFLFFINTPRKTVEIMVKKIKVENDSPKEMRELSPLINYLVIDHEINDLYSRKLDDETFIKWFPIFFWVNITYLLPLRATEMLITPKECIEHRDGKIFLKIRRTKLKGNKKRVFYDYKRDYEMCEYEIPNSHKIAIIEKYISLTKSQDRRFLFVHSKYMLNDLLSLASFNELLRRFMDERIIGNQKYDYAKYASGIREFEYVTAGDSRPIAMVNIYYQNAGADICRQLAGHINLETSAGYYGNVSEIVMGSSIMKMQKEIQEQNVVFEEMRLDLVKNVVNADQSYCCSEKRALDKDNIEDCEEQNHLEDCIGCKHYVSSNKEIDKYVKDHKKKVDDISKQIIESLKDISKLKGKEKDISELFLQIQTAASRLRIGYDIKAEEKKEEWQKHKSSKMTSY